MTASYSFYEFFAGGGMVRTGLGDAWSCLFANDFDLKKGRAYVENWGAEELVVGDVAGIAPADLPGRASLAWASFPCQDLSLAGAGAGLKGARSGTFWPFWKLLNTLEGEGRRPPIIALENVCGALTSAGGADFASLCEALSKAGYRYGALVVDAAHFVPQSRPRLFIIGVDRKVDPPKDLLKEAPDPLWSTKALEAAYDRLPPRRRGDWLWWSLPAPPARTATFADLIEEAPNSVSWKTPEETRRLLDMMSPVNRAKVRDAQRSGRRQVGALYRRTRINAEGQKVQRAEVRFDDVAGCLRTPAGGSSRQLLLIVDGPQVRARLISARETARLMGLPDAYQLPENYNEAYHLTGDGVVVPVIRYLAEHILEPLAAAAAPKARRRPAGATQAA